MTHINGTEAEYFEELSDPNSPEFKEMEENVCNPVISGFPWFYFHACLYPWLKLSIVMLASKLRLDTCCENIFITKLITSSKC